MKNLTRATHLIVSLLALACTPEDYVNCPDGFEYANGMCVACPEYDDPPCGEGEVLSSEPDENGCQALVCVPAPLECPQYDIPLCEDGEVLSSELDENGCEAPVCVPEDGICPETEVPMCDRASVLTTQIDENGCEYQVCEPA